MQRSGRRRARRKALAETIGSPGVLLIQGEKQMTDHKKKGDFHKNGKDDVGGDKKQHADRNEDSRTGNQNSGGGGRD